MVMEPGVLGLALPAAHGGTLGHVWNTEEGQGA